MSKPCPTAILTLTAYVEVGREGYTGEDAMEAFKEAVSSLRGVGRVTAKASIPAEEVEL